MAASNALKVPPHDIVAEKSVLGGILIDPPAIGLVVEILASDHFYEPRHQMIFLSMLGLYEKRQPVDVVTLSAELKSSGDLKKIGGTPYLSELIEIVPTSANIIHYARIVKNQHIKRRLITMSSHLVEKSMDETGDVKNLLNTAETEIFSLSQAYMHQDFVHLKDIVAHSFERLEEFKKVGGGLRGLPTGYIDIDNKLAGMQDSNLLILAARPGIGKTTLALNIAINCALKVKAPVGVFSLEMSKEELVDRLLVGQADIDAWRLKTGRLTDDDYSRLTEAMGDLSQAPIYIDDTPGASILEMRSKARKLKIEKGLKLLIVDYLQLVDPGKRIENRSQEVSFISQNLKNLARELKIPVIALSQLSRAIEHRGEKKPQLADLRESGAIEQDADIVMFLYYENDSEDLLDQSKRMIKLYIAKHRNGSTGDIDLMFRGDRVKFYGVEH
ncbi:MAG TPA: replicative DNA helicase [Candidatus Nitrosocosmicus sp.]|nr:replicative DNA helicase [Candidatus Nitrosocosmicus sp.]